MELYPINIWRLQTVESGQFVVRFLTDFDNQGLNAATDIEVKTLYDSLKLQSPIYNLAMMQITARAESVLLLELDTARDHRVSALKHGLDVHEFTDDATEMEQYLLVKIVIEKYKNIERMNFEAETLGISNFCAELRDATHLAAVTALGLVPLVDKMETANNNFKTIFDQRSTGVIDTTVYNTKLLRKTILETYRDLADYVLIMAKRKNTAYYIDILKVLNNGRKYYADILSIRKGHATPPPKPE